MATRQQQQPRQQPTAGDCQLAATLNREIGATEARLAALLAQRREIMREQATRISYRAIARIWGITDPAVRLALGVLTPPRRQPLRQPDGSPVSPALRRPAPPLGFRPAGSAREVYDACRRAGRDLVLRVWVKGEWVPGTLDAAISSRPARVSTITVPVAWGRPPYGSAARVRYDRVAVLDTRRARRLSSLIVDLGDPGQVEVAGAVFVFAFDRQDGWFVEIADWPLDGPTAVDLLGATATVRLIADAPAGVAVVDKVTRWSDHRLSVLLNGSGPPPALSTTAGAP